MQWRRFIMFATVTFVTWNHGPARAEALDRRQLSDGLEIHHGTLVVAVMESNQVAIAIDSRATANRPDRTNSVEDGFEKVKALSSHIAFFSTGAREFQTRSFTNNLADTAKSLADDWKKSGRRIEMETLAQQFKAVIADDLARLSVPDIQFLHRVAASGGGSNILQAVFAGQDSDGLFKMFQVTGYAMVETNGGKTNAHLSFDVFEKKRIGHQWFVFYGSTKVFDDGMNDPKAPLAPVIRQLRTSSSRLAEPTAASVLAAGVSEYGDGPESPVGWPLFVYVIDANGLRMTRKVGKGETVPFDPRAQGK